MASHGVAQESSPQRKLWVQGSPKRLQSPEGTADPLVREEERKGEILCALRSFALYVVSCQFPVAAHKISKTREISDLGLGFLMLCGSGVE